MIEHKELLEIIAYEKDIGLFTWKRKKYKSHLIGKNAGCKKKTGYIEIDINKKTYRAHRLAIFYCTGNWPKNDVDHINGIRNDNRLSNLREATRSENLTNQRKCHKDSKTGVLGVTYSKHEKKYRATICINYKVKALGSFKRKEDASNAYLSAKRDIHSFNTI